MRIGYDNGELTITADTGIDGLLLANAMNAMREDGIALTYEFNQPEAGQLTLRVPLTTPCSDGGLDCDVGACACCDCEADCEDCCNWPNRIKGCYIK